MVATPNTIYYDYDTEQYTTTCPPNNHNYDVYGKVNTERQIEFDSNPAQRKWFKDRPRDCTQYKSTYAETDENIYLYWQDYRSELNRQHTNTGHIDIDLALNNIL